MADRISVGDLSGYAFTIDDLEFFQGDTVDIPFLFVDANGDDIIIQGQDYVKWYLCPFGQYKNTVMELSSQNADEITVDISYPDNGGSPQCICYVHLNADNTKYLTYGKYTQQPVLFHNTGSVTEQYRRAQGTILMKQKIYDL